MVTFEQIVEIPVSRGSLGGILFNPPERKGVILFAHGSGSGRSSPRNQRVAGTLNRHGFSTLLFDLLTDMEEDMDKTSGHLRFNIELLSQRLVFVTDWMREHYNLFNYPIGYFGASTGAAAALEAATKRPYFIKAVVSRGGRPDLAANALGFIQVPTLFIVGEKDTHVLDLNRQAFNQISCPQKDLKVISGATHLFEEPGALDEVAGLSAQWFEKYMR